MGLWDPPDCLTVQGYVPFLQPREYHASVSLTILWIHAYSVKSSSNCRDTLSTSVCWAQAHPTLFTQQPSSKEVQDHLYIHHQNCQQLQEMMRPCPLYLTSGSHRSYKSAFFYIELNTCFLCIELFFVQLLNAEMWPHWWNKHVHR